MLELIMLVIAAGGIGGGYVKVRRFVRSRLQYVDQVQQRRAAWIAGGAAVLAAVPVVWLLPVLGGGTALVFGLGVGLGVSHGARDIQAHRLLADPY
jgi:hypothetical protein